MKKPSESQAELEDSDYIPNRDKALHNLTESYKIGNNYLHELSTRNKAAGKYNSI